MVDEIKELQNNVQFCLQKVIWVTPGLRSRIPNNTRSRSRDFLSDSDSPIRSFFTPCS